MLRRRLIRWASSFRGYSCSRLDKIMCYYKIETIKFDNLHIHWSPLDTCLNRSHSCPHQPRDYPRCQSVCCTTAGPHPPRPTPRGRSCHVSPSSRWRGRHKRPPPLGQTRHCTCYTCPGTLPTLQCQQCEPRSCQWRWSTTACHQNPRTGNIDC